MPAYMRVFGLVLRDLPSLGVEFDKAVMRGPGDYEALDEKDRRRT